MVSLLESAAAAVGPYVTGGAQVVGTRTGGGLVLVDVREATGAGHADPSGICTVVLDEVSPATYWRVTRVIVSSTSRAYTPQCVLYDGLSESDCIPQNVLDGTADGSLDVSDVPFYVQSSRSLIAQWTGADPAAGCNIRVQYELMSRS